MNEIGGQLRAVRLFLKEKMMTERYEIVKNYIYDKLTAVEPPKSRNEGIRHITAVSQYAILLANVRGENAELAGIAGLFHDLYAYVTGIRKEHAKGGAHMAKDWLDQSDLFTKEEKEAIVGAVYFHSEKGTVHLPLDEILKDADVLDHILMNPGAFIGKEKERAEKLMEELHFA